MKEGSIVVIVTAVFAVMILLTAWDWRNKKKYFPPSSHDRNREKMAALKKERDRVY